MGKVGSRGTQEPAQVHSSKRRLQRGCVSGWNPSILTPREVKNKQRKEKCTELRWKTWGKEERTKCGHYRGGGSRSRRGGERTLMRRRKRGGGSEGVDDGGEGKNESNGESLRGKERVGE